MTRIFTFEFPRSRARAYSLVVTAARRIPGVTEGDPNVISLPGHLLRANLRAFTYVIEHATWAGCNLRLDDVPMNGTELHHFRRMIRCYAERQADPIPARYCTYDGRTACRLLQGLAYPDRSLGRIGVLRAVVREMHLRYVYLCPALDRQEVLKCWRAVCPGPLTSDDIWRAIQM